jgi:hypothetical protein
VGQFQTVLIGHELGFKPFLKGHEFTRAVKIAIQTWASAPEGWFFEIDPLPGSGFSGVQKVGEGEAAPSKLPKEERSSRTGNWMASPNRLGRGFA